MKAFWENVSSHCALSEMGRTGAQVWRYLYVWGLCMCVHFSKAAGLYHCWICSVCVAVSACTCLPDGHKPAPQQSMSFTHISFPAVSINSNPQRNLLYLPACRLLLSLQAHLTRTHTLASHTLTQSHAFFFEGFQSPQPVCGGDKTTHRRKEKSQWWMVCTAAAQCSTINVLLINVCHWPPTIWEHTHRHTHTGPAPYLHAIISNWH